MGGSDIHHAKIRYDSHVYFVLSLRFVVHSSLVPTYTNTKYAMIPTFFVYSRLTSLIVVRYQYETPVSWQGKEPMITYGLREPGGTGPGGTESGHGARGKRRLQDGQEHPRAQNPKR